MGKTPRFRTFFSPIVYSINTELFGVLLANKGINEVNLNTNLRTLGEVGQVKNLAIKNLYATQANQEYLGYELKEKALEVQYLFNPLVALDKLNADSLEEALKPGKATIDIDENIDKDTLEGKLAILIEAARIVKSVHFRPIDIKGNPIEQIVSLIKAGKELRDLFTKDDFDDFLESLKVGFADKTDDPTVTEFKPFDRPFENRPGVRDVSPPKNTVPQTPSTTP